MPKFPANPRLLLRLAAVLGLLGVGLGAAGAHALKPVLAAAGRLEAWQTAVVYHLIHAVAVLAMALAAEARGPVRPFIRAAWCWTAGTVLFSGSLYALALGAPRWLGPVTPAGGLLLLCGWGMLLSGDRGEAGPDRP